MSVTSEKPENTSRQTTDLSLNNSNEVRDQLVQEVSSSIEDVLAKLVEVGVLTELVEDIKQNGDTGHLAGSRLVDGILEEEKIRQVHLLNVLTQLQLTTAVELFKQLQSGPSNTEDAIVKERESPQDTNKKVEESKEFISYTKVLLESRGTFIDCLHVTPDLMGHLIKSSVLSQDMVIKVLCRPNRPDKVRVLLSFLMNLGPESLTAFIEALRATEQHFLANILAVYNFT